MRSAALKKHTKLAELAVGDQKLPESAETLNCLVAVLLCGLLVDWCIHGVCIALADGLGLPNEVLEQVALVLGEHQDLGLLDDMAQVLDEALTFSRELLARLRETLPLEGSVHRHINLLVLRRRSAHARFASCVFARIPMGPCHWQML